MNETTTGSMTTTEDASASGGESVIDEAKDALERATGHARERIGGGIEAKREKVVETMGGAAQALRTASTKLKEPGPLPALADRAANTIDRIAEFIDQRSLRDVANSVQHYAQREPGKFVGAAFAIGLLTGRFLKSSAKADVEPGISEERRDARYH